MDDAVDTVERPFDGGGVADVAADELDVVVEVVGTAVLVAVDLRIEIVEDPNAITVLEEPVGEMRADESRPSRDQDRPAHRTSLFVAHASFPTRTALCI